MTLTNIIALIMGFCFGILTAGMIYAYVAYAERIELTETIEKSLGEYGKFSGFMGFQGIVMGITSFQTESDRLRDKIIDLINEK